MPYDIISMWNLKYDINELIYKTETDSQTHRTDLRLPRRWRGVGETDWESGISRCKLLYVYRMGKQQGPSVQHSELHSMSCDKSSWKKNEK